MTTPICFVAPAACHICHAEVRLQAVLRGEARACGNGRHHGLAALRRKRDHGAKRVSIDHAVPSEAFGSHELEGSPLVAIAAAVEFDGEVAGLKVHLVPNETGRTRRE